MEKRLAVIVDGLCIGGAQVQTINLLNGLIDYDYKILLINLGSDNVLQNRISGKISLIELGKKHSLDFSVLKKLISLLREYKANFILLVNPYAMFYGFIASFFINKSKKVFVSHSTLVPNLIEEIKYILYKRIMNMMDRIIFVSEKQKNHWVDHYSIKIQKTEVIYNGIDIGKFCSINLNTLELRKSLGISPTEIVVGINACLRAEKKHETVIDAIAMLSADGYPIKLLMVGDGDRRLFIEEYIKEKHLQDKVIITGFIEEVKPYLACFDISVLASITEALSIAVLETMAMGKPAVISDVGGARELVVDGENGFVFRIGDTHGFYQSLKYIIDHNLFQFMGQKSRERAEQIFDQNLMIKKYHQVFSNC
jgi:glycosyltransferase involved in cell wall biosynthesis